MCKSRFFLYNDSMTTNTMKANLEITLPSLPDSVEKVEAFLQDCCIDCPLTDRQYGDILLVLTEAVNNGITHGNRNNPGKQVKLSFYKREESLNFRVCDEGMGFNPSDLPDPTNREYVDQPNGRGVYIMRQLADQLRFEDEGRTVLIQFCR